MLLIALYTHSTEFREWKIACDWMCSTGEKIIEQAHALRRALQKLNTSISQGDSARYLQDLWGEESTIARTASHLLARCWRLRVIPTSCLMYSAFSSDSCPRARSWRHQHRAHNEAHVPETWRRVFALKQVLCSCHTDMSCVVFDSCMPSHEHAKYVCVCVSENACVMYVWVRLCRRHYSPVTGRDEGLIEVCAR